MEVYARRLQIQERMTAQIADDIMKYLAPQGVMVMLEAEHLCMTMRGIKKPMDIKGPTLEEYGYALKAFINAGLEVQITELDITINFDTDDTDGRTDRKSTRLNSSHSRASRMPSSA